MPKTRLQIERALIQQRQLQNLPKSFIASLGDRNGTVSAGGGKVYVRDIISGFTFLATNVSVPNISGRLVNVEQRGRELYVVGFWNIYGGGDNSESYVAPHTHGYGDENPIFISKDQLKPFLVLPYSGFTVQVFGGVFITSLGEFGVLANQQVDLSGYQPASGALYVLLEYDDTGTVSVTAGSAALNKDALTLDDIPIITDHPLCAVRLYASQAAISRDPGGLYDFVDPRLCLYDPVPPHNRLSDIDGGGDYLGVLEAYHLSEAQWDALVKNFSADGYHFHSAQYVVVDPYGCIESTNVQDALEELEAKIDALPQAGGGSWDGDVDDVDTTSGSEIGAALEDADRLLGDDDSSGNPVWILMSRIWTYISGKFEPTPDYTDISGNDAATDVSGAELEELTDGSETVLHSHAVTAWDGDVDDVDTTSGSEIGAALEDADRLLGDDDSSGNPVWILMSRVWTYIESKLQAVTDLSSYSWFLDEDDMASDDATKVASQQSIKAYVDSRAPKEQWTGTGANGQVPASSTRYLGPQSEAGLQTGASQLPTSVKATVTSITFVTGDAQPATGSLVITVLVNGAASGFSLTIPAGSAAGTYSATGTANLNASDLWGYQVVNNATSTGPRMRGYVGVLEY